MQSSAVEAHLLKHREALAVVARLLTEGELVLRVRLWACRAAHGGGCRGNGRGECTLLEGTFLESTLQEGTLQERALLEGTLLEGGGCPPGGCPSWRVPLLEGTLLEGTLLEGTLLESTSGGLLQWKDFSNGTTFPMKALLP